MLTEDKKRYREKATRALRELRKEKKLYGSINDGPGRRYRVGVYFLLAGDLAAASDALDWFDVEFDDDVGEPVFLLYGALTAYRQGDHVKARWRLLQAMQSNIYLLSFLAGVALPPLDIWHSSNWHRADYLLEIESFLDEPSQEERRWIAVELETAAFRKMRDGYLSTFFALNGESDFVKRGDILKTWHRLQAECFAMITDD